MKILLTIIFLSLLSSPSWSVSYDDLVERDGVYYKKFSDVPFSGKVTEIYKGSIKNGKREGAWISYYDNGQLDFKGNYKNGKEEGEWIDYERVLRDGAWVRRVLIKGTGMFRNGVKISD